jgi:hypothetical protein
MTTVLLPAPTSQALYDAMIASHPGDIIECPSGEYGIFAPPLGIRHAEPYVTIRPAPEARPVFENFNLWGGVGGYIVEGLECAMAPTTQFGFNMDGGSVDIWIRRCIAHQRDNKTLAGVGIYVRDSLNITLEENKVSFVGDGMSGVDNTNLAVVANELHHIQSNAIFFTGTKGGRIALNRGTLFFNLGGTHPDFIQQARSYATGEVCEDMVIEDNFYERGEGEPVQGIFDEDSINNVIRRNAILGGLYNGIATARSQHMRYEENFIQPYVGQGSSLGVRQEADDIQIINNAAYVWVGASGEPQPTNVTQEGNYTVPDASGPGDYTEYDKWRASLAPPDPEPPEPVDPCWKVKLHNRALKHQLRIANARIAAAQLVLGGGPHVAHHLR